MRQIIQSNSVSYATARADIDNYLKSYPEYAQLQRNSDTNTLNIIYNMMVDFSINKSYEYQMNRRETFLSQAQLPSSIYNRANEFSYNIQRPTSPVLSFKYLGVSTIKLVTGTVIATTANGDSITYFGETKLIEKGDLIQCVIGVYQSINTVVQTLAVSGIQDYLVSLTPSDAAFSVDNQFVKLRLMKDNSLLYVSKVPEDYIVGPLKKINTEIFPTINDMLSANISLLNVIAYIEEDEVYYQSISLETSTLAGWRKVCDLSKYKVKDGYTGKALDFSSSLSSTNILITNPQYQQGIDVALSEEIEISWIETKGYQYIGVNDTINYEDSYTEFFLYSVDSLGTVGDDLERVRFLVPFYRSTLRRAVTRKDYKYILEANEYIVSCEVEKDKGKQEKGIFTFETRTVDTVYTFILGSIATLEYKVLSNDVFTGGTGSVQAKVINLLNATGLVICTVDGEKINVQTHPDVYLGGFNYNQVYYNGLQTLNVKYEITQEAIRPKCCTINAYYIKTNTVDNPLELTTYEAKIVSDYLDELKMVEATVQLIPAKKASYDLALQVKLKNTSYKQAVYDEIIKLLATYELSLSTAFYYGTFLAQVAQIEILDTVSNEYFKPIDFILPNQTIFDVPASKDTYMKFNFTLADLHVI